MADPSTFQVGEWVRLKAATRREMDTDSYFMARVQPDLARVSAQQADRAGWVYDDEITLDFLLQPGGTPDPGEPVGRDRWEFRRREIKHARPTEEELTAWTIAILSA